MNEPGEAEARPSPEALLKAAGRSGRGRLKIFLGAAPGVGKTYTMLEAAHDRLRENVDVIVGVVETHGRAETLALTEGLPAIPKTRVDYKGRQLEEMDLDAILARKPGLVLVDELAHTNAPGSRHPKRYLDVEELLAAGINVYSTVNIQHLESLNDVVAQITQVRVQETVPDSVIENADEIELIDLTPDDLIQRLKDGKIYVAETATRALAHYFSPGNLTALRELALTRTAQRVDAQLLDHMQAHAIRGPWPASERILVCVDHRGGDTLVRYGKRMAERLRAPWTVIHIETPRDLRLPRAAQDKVGAALRLAEELGAEAITAPGAEVASALVAYARERNFTQIVVGNTPKPGLWRPSIPARIIHMARDIPVHVIGTEGEATARADTVDWAPLAFQPSHYLASLALVAAATVIAGLLKHVLNVSSISLVYLTAVLMTAASFGLGPSLFACLASVLAYNFFFLDPIYTFTVSDPENVVTLVFFALASLIGSQLAARAREQAVDARARARTTEALYQFSRKLAGIVHLDDLLWATAYQVATMLKLRVVVLLPDAAEPDKLAVRGAYPPEDEIDDQDLAAAQWSWRSNRPAGRGADTLPGAPRLFLPLRTAKGPVAVLGIDRDQPPEDRIGPLLDPDEQRLLDALCDQAAVSIERIHLAEDVEKSRLLTETERLRAALLTSISHDLRTPLSAILGSASTLQTFEKTLDEAARRDLLATISEEAERMGRFVANLLDMTRLESGAVARQSAPLDVGELIGSTLKRAEKILARHEVVLEVETDLPLLDLDGMLFEQALFNLLDNAAKYAPEGTMVTIRAWTDAGQAQVHIQVMDEGPGIPADSAEKIFDKFFRLRAQDRVAAGTGLGLAVCRGFVEAMHGAVTAANRTDRRGSVFTLHFPYTRARA